MKYRAEIDGLRAVAVVPVILFHAGIGIFSGGFVGVDIFFVISGYLITTILIDDIEKHRFSIARFYERRIRRILPALFFVMMCCVPFAWMWMLPSQLKSFSQSFIAVSFFLSNVLFWRESGYFEVAAEQKPLLHTWSLAVEEQYYLLFPVFLLLAWRFGKVKVFYTIVGLAILSLSLSEWGWRHAPSANFYLAPTRAWELLAGSVAAFIVQRNGVRTNQALAFSGLIFILFAIFIFDERTPFPSAFTLVPVLGVVLVILFAEKDTLTARILSTKLLVGLGLISYSAYLWHQPIFSFARMQSIGDMPTTTALFLSGIAIIFATLTWKYVEAPFRDRNSITNRQLLWLAAAGFCVMVSIGLLGQAGVIRSNYKEMQTRESKPPFSRNCEETLPEEIREACTIIGYEGAKPSILLLGDSHASAIRATLSRALNNEKKSAYAITRGSCTPIYGVSTETSNYERCIEQNKYVYEHLLPESTIKDIILMSRWTAQWRDSTPFDNREGGLEKFPIGLAEKRLALWTDKGISFNKSLIRDRYVETIEHLANTANLVLVYPTPEVGWLVPNALHAARIRGTSVESNYLSTDAELFSTRNEEMNSLLDQIKGPISRIDASSLFCNTYVPTRCVSQIDGVPLYYDDDHLSDFGASLIVPSITASLSANRSP